MGVKKEFKKEFILEEFSKGDFLAWEVLTQTASLCNVTLKCGDTEYFNVEKTNTSTKLQVLSQDSRFYDHDQPLTLIVTVRNGECEPKASTTSGAITDQKMRRVGYTYSFCLEDYLDEDYNDVYINIVGWKNNG